MLDLYQSFILLSLAIISLSLFFSSKKEPEVISVTIEKKIMEDKSKSKPGLVQKLKTIHETTVDDLKNKEKEKDKEDAYQKKLAIIRKRLKPKVSSSSADGDSFV